MLALFHTPPLWLIFGFLILALASIAFVIRGTYILLTRQASKNVLFRTAIVQVVILGLSGACSLLGKDGWINFAMMAGFPFGLSTVLVLVTLIFNVLSDGFGAPDGLMIPLMLLGVVLNFVGILSIVHFVSNRRKYQ